MALPFSSRRRRAAVVACLVAVAAPALAQEPTPAPVDPDRLAAARAVFEATHAERMLKGMLGNVMKSMPPAAAADPAADAKARQMMASMSAGFDATLPRLVDAEVEAYARTFTLREMQDLAAFYGSPSGQAMLVKMPQLMQQLTPMVVRFLPGMFAATEADFCAHVTCTDADRTVFRRMEAGGREH